MKALLLASLFVSTAYAGNTTYLDRRGVPMGYAIQEGDQTIYLDRRGVPMAYGLSDQSMQQSIANTPRRRSITDGMPSYLPGAPSPDPMDLLSE